MNIQVICDARGMVEDIVARWPGSVHDTTIFLNSEIFERFLNGEFRKNGQESILLGDGAYKSEFFLAVPLRQTNRQFTRAEKMYQQAHISTRNIIERFFGQWKKRFPCLWIGMRFRKLETVMNVIVATAVLHNICKIHGDKMPQLTRDEELRYIAAKRNEDTFAQEIQSQPNHTTTTIRNELLRNHFERATRQQQSK